MAIIAITLQSISLLKKRIMPDHCLPDNGLSAEILSTDGPFAKHWPHFKPRAGQQRMSSLVETAVAEQRPLIVEAASGSGKTLAYLVPIITQNRKAIISTASRYLQTQLYRHDLPLVQKVLGSSKSVVQLQGRSHYLCPYYLEKSLQDDVFRDTKKQLVLRQLAKRFRDTGIGEIELLAPQLPVSLRSSVTSSRDDCLAKLCPQFSNCPLMKVRQSAQVADIVIVNHSLLFSDQVMRREQLGDLLPAAEVVIVDEAHRIADFAQTLVGQHLSSRKLRGFCRTALEVLANEAPEQRSLQALLRKIESGLQSLCASLPSLDHYQRVQHVGIVEQLLSVFEQSLKNFDLLSERAQTLAELTIKNRLLVEKLRSITRLDNLCWVQGNEHGFQLHGIPSHFSSLLKSLLVANKGGWVFTSATLSVGGKPDHFIKSLGLENTSFYQVESEIDFSYQARLYLPLLPVDPSSVDFNDHFIEKLLSLIPIVNGRVLCLFSSYDSLNKVADKLRQKADYPLFVQGTEQGAGNNYRLIEAFKSCENGVLLGTGSFWEGLDLSGVPLSAVVVDKLPFASPGDALVKLRSNELADYGVDSFKEYLLPDAIIRLRQGCGRLLRRLSDRGVIMIADPRLHSKTYGRAFIESLPPMEQVKTLEPLKAFFNASHLEDLNLSRRGVE
jgi:ATP-dependent DNA helicase DinG